jgi:WD40 repeat protein
MTRVSTLPSPQGPPLPAAHRPCGALKEHTDSVLALAFTGDGRVLATGGGDKTGKLWDVATGQEPIALKVFKDAARSLAFVADDTLLAAGS